MYCACHTVSPFAVCLFVCLFGWLVGWLVCLFVCLFVSLFVCLISPCFGGVGTFFGVPNQKRQATSSEAIKINSLVQES